jgi:hypothetical protein
VAFEVVLHVRAAPPDNDGGVRSLVMEPAGGLDIGLPDRIGHRGRLESSNLARMTCPALFLGPAGEDAGNHENDQGDHSRRR